MAGAEIARIHPYRVPRGSCRLCAPEPLVSRPSQASTPVIRDKHTATLDLTAPQTPAIIFAPATPISAQAIRIPISQPTGNRATQGAYTPFLQPANDIGTDGSPVHRPQIGLARWRQFQLGRCRHVGAPRKLSRAQPEGAGRPLGQGARPQLVCEGRLDRSRVGRDAGGKARTRAAGRDSQTQGSRGRCHGACPGPSRQAARCHGRQRHRGRHAQGCQP